MKNKIYVGRGRQCDEDKANSYGCKSVGGKGNCEYTGKPCVGYNPSKFFCDEFDINAMEKCPVYSTLKETLADRFELAGSNSRKGTVTKLVRNVLEASKEVSDRLENRKKWIDRSLERGK